MQILGASLNVSVREFLHAGYLSCYPRTYVQQGVSLLESQSANVIDVRQALQLKNAKRETEQAEGTRTVEAALPGQGLPAAVLASDGFAIAILFFFFACLISVYRRRAPSIAGSTRRFWLLGGVLTIVIAVVLYVVFPIDRAVFPLDHTLHLSTLPGPWEGIPIEQYEDPMAASEAILHTLVIPALAGCPVPAQSLAAIQYEVRFPLPTDRCTPGMLYAQRTYGRDGWGRDFRFETSPDVRRYRLTSAGADGVTGTSDDIIVTWDEWEDSRHKASWESLLNGVYVSQAEGEPAVIIHRVADTLFRQAHAADARQLTGTHLFDAFSFAEMFPVRQSGSEGPILTELKKRRILFQPQGQTGPVLLFFRFQGREHG